VSPGELAMATIVAWKVGLVIRLVLFYSAKPSTLSEVFRVASQHLAFDLSHVVFENVINRLR